MFCFPPYLFIGEAKLKKYTGNIQNAIPHPDITGGEVFEKGVRLTRRRRLGVPDWASPIMQSAAAMIRRTC